MELPGCLKNLTILATDNNWPVDKNDMLDSAQFLNELGCIPDGWLGSLELCQPRITTVVSRKRSASIGDDNGGLKKIRTH
jgi:hypothetical protein